MKQVPLFSPVLVEDRIIIMVIFAFHTSFGVFQIPWGILETQVVWHLLHLLSCFAGGRQCYAIVYLPIKERPLRCYVKNVTC